MNRSWMRYAWLLLLPLFASGFTVEPRAYYFRPSEKVVRSIYGKAWIGGGVRIGDVPLPWDSLSLFLSLDYLSRNGRSLGGDESTSVVMFPVTPGLQWNFFRREKIDLYVGGGPRYYTIWTKNNSNYVPHKLTRSGWGSYINGGMLLPITESIRLDAFVGYSMKRFGAPKVTSPILGFSDSVGGLEAGGGLAFGF